MRELTSLINILEDNISFIKHKMSIYDCLGVYQNLWIKNYVSFFKNHINLLKIKVKYNFISSKSSTRAIPSSPN